VAVVLVAAVLLARRDAAQVALIAYAAFGIPHLAYHVAERAPRLTGAEQLQAVGMLGFGLVLAAVLAVLLRREAQPAPVG
jgi:hypothetical protein